MYVRFCFEYVLLYFVCTFQWFDVASSENYYDSKGVKLQGSCGMGELDTGAEKTKCLKCDIIFYIQYCLELMLLRLLSVFGI